ncbi:MAG: SusC/RagA family TonB-linked outer membrane protein [Ginsengibacter sp.]
MRKILALCTVLLFCGGIVFAQGRIITGTVTDETGSPLSDISVLVKGTQVGTVTSSDGKYSLSVSADAKFLIFSSVNMKSVEMPIGSRSIINARMVTSDEALDEVIIQVPYGSIKKTAFTGSENTITSQTIEKQQVTSVTKALEGVVPGIISTNGGGKPGSGASILIRGIGSVNASSGPLYVLNGVPYDGSISSLSTDDIESVTVLKDAAAAALYGSRAANGVIMITTKQGKRGAPATTVSLRQGFMNRGIPEYDRVGPKDYYEVMWEAYRNNYFAQGNNMPASGVSASNILAGPNGLVYNAYNVPANQLVNPVTGKLNSTASLLWDESWEDALFRTASRTNAFFNVSGATDKVDYYLSAGYLNEEGTVRFSGYKRYNMRLSVNADATNWLRTGLNLDGAIVEDKMVPSGGTSTTNPFYFTRQMGPIYPVYQHDLTTGAFVHDPLTGKNALDWGTPEQMGTRPYAGRSNLLGSLDLDDRSRSIFNGNANTYGEIKFTKEFSFKATLGLNFYTTNGTSYQNNQFGDAAPSPGLNNGGRSTKDAERQMSLTANEVFSFNKSIGVHDVRVLAGHENYRYQYNFRAGYMSGFLFPGQTELDNGTTAFSVPTSYEDNHRIESYFSAVNYSFENKYLLSGSFRTDGSSRFKEDVRWGDFYSAGIGWRLSKEAFLQDVSWINELKLKASYGEQGNENIGLYYPYRSYYYANGDGTYRPPSRPVNAGLLWEKNKTTNIGMDFSLAGNRIQGSLEWFNRVSDNLLFDVPLPISTGYASFWDNIGSMKNTGVELQLGYTAIRKRDFNWRIDINLSTFKNEITKLPPNQSEKGIVSGTKKLLVGHSIYDFWLRDYAGVDASTGDALYYKDVLDANGKATGAKTVTNVYNDGSYGFHGSAIPDFTGGVTNSFRYKNFDLSVLTTFSYGGLFYDGNYASIMHRGSAGTAWSADILQRWQKPGDVTTVPRVQNAIAGQDGASTRWLMDGSYLNIKNVTLSYTLASEFAERIHLTGLQIFCNVDNAYLFTAKKGMDPQRSFAGTSDATYTPFRTVSVGFTAKLK